MSSSSSNVYAITAMLCYLTTCIVVCLPEIRLLALYETMLSFCFFLTLSGACNLSVLLYLGSPGHTLLPDEYQTRRQQQNQATYTNVSQTRASDLVYSIQPYNAGSVFLNTEPRSTNTKQG